MHRSLALTLWMCLLLAACGDEEPTANDDSTATSGTADDTSTAGAEADGSGDAADPDATVVDRVIDGDSVELDVDDTIVEARLIGINAPELADCQGPASRDALAGIAGGQTVDVVDYGSDRYGRLLVALSINDESVNLAMVRSGWALGQHSDEHPDADAWVAAMERAAEDGLGMWDHSDACPASTHTVRLGDAQPDPPGPDDEVLADEWIEIVNEGATTVDLEGWALRDESTSNRLVFGSVTLEPGGRLRVHTGCGQDGATSYYWCSDFGVWSNQGDTALILSPTGSIEDWTVLAGR